MGRKRKNPKDNQLPTRVYRGRASYEWHPKAGGSVRLCSLNAPLSEVWEKYEAVYSDKPIKNTVKALTTAFLQSPEFRELSAATQRNYAFSSNTINQVFGKMDINKVEPSHIRRYMDKRGATAPSQANADHGFFSRCYQYGYERGLAKRNPCRGIRRFQEKPNTRHVTDVEYDAIYSAAHDDLTIAMELCRRTYS